VGGDGYDAWDDASWADNPLRAPMHGSTTRGGASGVGIRQEIADAYVVMRLAELICEQRVRSVVESAVINFGGNGGCLALQKLAAALVEHLELIESDPAAADVRTLWSNTTRN
jgi:hypothetical protein